MCTRGKLNKILLDNNQKDDNVGKIYLNIHDEDM